MRGSSPLQAALRRLVADELTQNTDNQEACTVLFDVESFYDSISLSLVARAGLKLAYPPVLLSLALLAYAGVRFLTAGCSDFSEGIVISNGVAAGCAQGNHAARLALYDILQKSHELHPSTTTAQWVDDLAQRTQAPPSEVVNKAVEAVDGRFQIRGYCNHTANHQTGCFCSCKTRNTHPGSQSSQGSGIGCVKCKKADTSYHG